MAWSTHACVTKERADRDGAASDWPREIVVCVIAVAVAVAVVVVVELDVAIRTSTKL